MSAPPSPTRLDPPDQELRERMRRDILASRVLTDVPMITQVRQMQARFFASGGTLSSTSRGMATPTHQQAPLFLTAAQSFSPPQSGHRAGWAAPAVTTVLRPTAVQKAPSSTTSPLTPTW